MPCGLVRGLTLAAARRLLEKDLRSGPRDPGSPPSRESLVQVSFSGEAHEGVAVRRAGPGPSRRRIGETFRDRFRS